MVVEIAVGAAAYLGTLFCLFRARVADIAAFVRQLRGTQRGPVPT